MVMPDDPLADLPEIEPRPDGGGEAYDPLLELTKLTQSNAQRMNDLAKEGVQLQDSHPMVTMNISNALLEEILKQVAGEGTVVRVLLETHQQIADMLTNAEQSVRRAKIVGGAQHDGRITRSGHVT